MTYLEPAFPSIPPREDLDISYHNGMSLRDYFAAKAMQKLASHIACPPDRVNEEILLDECLFCYKWADAMLKAREAK